MSVRRRGLPCIESARPGVWWDAQLRVAEPNLLVYRGKKSKFAWG